MRSGVNFHYHKQSGVALLILVITLVLAALAYAFTGISITEIKLDQTKSTLNTLKQAKQAVIAYAVLSTEIDADEDTVLDRPGEYGFLPCSDYTVALDQGIQDGNCGVTNANNIGWLPWKTLKLPHLKDSSGTCLLYAVTGSYKLTPKTAMLNEDNLGMFQILNSTGVIQGVNAEDMVVAIIFAPGDELDGQNRNHVLNTDCGEDYNFTAYLEGDGATDNSTVSVTADMPDQFIRATEVSSTAATPYNDKFLTITREEIWDAIVERDDFKQKMENLTQALAMCLHEYANKPGNNSDRLPWPALIDHGATPNYRVNVSYTDEPNAPEGYSGRYPYQIGDSNVAIYGAFGQNILFDIDDGANDLCDDLNLSGTPAGPFVDLTTATMSEYRKLYNNWKDHFFYILSRDSRPANFGEDECDESGGVCIRVNGIKYAGAVIYSGSRKYGATRNDKSVVADYLEGAKVASFAAERINRTGGLEYAYTDPDADDPDIVNDIMYCIPKDIDEMLTKRVIECAP